MHHTVVTPPRLPRSVNALEKLGTSLIDFAGRQRRAVSSAVYSAVTAFSLALAFVVRFDFQLAVLSTATFALALALLVPIRLAVDYAFRLGFSRWRYVGIRDLLRLVAAMTTGSLIFLVLVWGIPGLPREPRSVILMEWVFTGYLTGGIWVLYRLAYEHLRSGHADGRTRVLVVGAGEAGQMLVQQMQRSAVGLLPVALVDDDPFKWGTLVHGVEVVGAVRDVGTIAEASGAEQVLIAIPSATPRQLRLVIQSCEGTELPLKILPGIVDVLTGRAELSQIRRVEVEDLLGRDPVKLDLPELAQELRGKTVLVTGAAGSIGSELARQIARHAPGVLILLDQAETPLYYLELEMRKAFPRLRLVVMVGSVDHADTVFDIFSNYHPHRVFHAAAYKHVPMMQESPRAAVRANVLGTYMVAKAAGEHGAESFLLISTDKAVRPYNVMGATKRLAEQVCLHLQGRYPLVGYRAVRFGNVLGSNGSVIPLFRKQLEAGEPLTVTHEAVTRYFMTIPEAVQLVLKASVLPESRGRVSMLDMGEPVRILDLARNLLRLSGHPYRPGQNVIINGLRSGEKLHEELSAPDERVSATSVDRVSIVETAPNFGELPVHALSALVAGGVADLLAFLFEECPVLEQRAEARSAIRA